MPVQDFTPSRGVVRFNSFEVDLRAGELRRHGIRLKLQDQPFRLLELLLERPGDLVTREELQKRIWPSDTFVDFDRGLNNAVKRLRETLADSAESPRYIETLPKRGYRFIARIEKVASANGDAAVATPPPTAREGRPTQTKPVLSLRNWKGWVVAGVMLLAASAVLLGNRLIGRVAPPPIHSVAVLPLENLSGDPSQEYFADGMTEEIIAELSHLNGLRVISRTSVMHYKKADKSLPEIARELNVDSVVEGSVLRSGDRVRITVKLISARNDANLWAETYDGSLQDTLTVQMEVAKSIAGKFDTSVVQSAAQRHMPPRTVNLQAHEAYLLGFHEDDIANDLWNHAGQRKAVEEHRRRAIEFYQQAIRKDPNYAPAYLRLADSYNPSDVEEKARKALELDDRLAEAHLTLGQVLLVRDLNWQGAEKEFRRAIEVNPNYAPAYQGYAYYLDALGRQEEGLEEYHRAQALDPANDHLSGALYSRRDYTDLIDLERRTLATNPPGDTDANAVAHKVLMVAYARTGKTKESIEELASGISCMGFRDFADEIRRGYRSGGYEAGLRAYLTGAAKRPDWVFHWIDIFVYAELGERDQAFSRLARLNKDDPSLWQFVGSADFMPTLASLRIEPMWDRLHSDPRFGELGHRLGLPPEPINSSQH